MKLAFGNNYTVDTNVLITLMTYHPQDKPAYQAIWDEIETLIKQKNIFSTIIVYEEIIKYLGKNDQLKKWAISHKKCFFISPDKETWRLAQDIINKFPDLLNKKKLQTGEPDADPFLSYLGSKKLVFKSPTGSGKTIMMAEFLKQLVDDREIRQSLGFIWTAPRQLHIQSRDKLENYFETSRVLKCSYFEDLDDRKISENEILFFNWESINRVDNIYIRDNEQEFNLSKVLERAKEDGREIILVIDEAHHHATSQISQGLIQMIGPKLTIEVTATPATITNEDEKVFVQLDDVKKEGMVKKAVVLNDDFDNFIKQGKIKTQKLSGGSEELVIDVALKKRKELLKEFQKEGVNVNPLVLIQLPDRKTSLEDRIRERAESILKNKYKISAEKDSNKLAIWLSGEHINKENVERQDSEVEVLIFKQAIALGWDCPRAQILILFRQWHSPIFFYPDRWQNYENARAG